MTCLYGPISEFLKFLITCCGLCGSSLFIPTCLPEVREGVSGRWRRDGSWSHGRGKKGREGESTLLFSMIFWFGFLESSGTSFDEGECRNLVGTEMYQTGDENTKVPSSSCLFFSFLTLPVDRSSPDHKIEIYVHLKPLWLFILRHSFDYSLATRA